MGLGHLRRPRNFIFESIAFKRRLPCNPPLAGLTPGLGVCSSHHVAIVKTPAFARVFVWGE